MFIPLRLIVSLAFIIAVASPHYAFAQRDPAAAIEAKMNALFNSGRFAEAIPLAEQVLAIRERQSGPGSESVANALYNLAYIYEEAGRYADAAAAFQRVLGVYEALFGRENPHVADALDMLAGAQQAQGNHAEAEPLYRRSLAIREKLLGPDHLDVANALHNLADLYIVQVRYPEAEQLLKRSLAIRDKARRSRKPSVQDQKNYALSLIGLANLYFSEGRNADAESLYRKSLEIEERALGPGHPDVATSLGNLALLYARAGRYEDAEPLYARSLAIYEKALGPTHPEVGRTLMNLALLYFTEGRYAEAEQLNKRALDIRQAALGPDHPSVADMFVNLGALEEARLRYADAETFYKKALAIREKAFPPEHPAVGGAISNLAEVYREAQRFAEAEPLYKRALAIRENALGRDHSDTAETVNNLAWLYLDQGRYKDALPLVERLIASGQALPKVALPVLFGAQRAGLLSPRKAIDEALNVAQRAAQTSAAAAIGKLGARLAAGGSRLGQLVRQDQDLAGEAEGLDKALIAAVSTEASKRDAANEQRMKTRLAEIENERRALQKVFESEFPDYVALAKPQPLTAKEIQALLSPDEAIVFFAAAGEAGAERTFRPEYIPAEIFVFALTRDGFDWKSIPLGGDALAQKVAAFRRGLNVEMVEDQAYLDSINVKRELFDLFLANELYTALLGPVNEFIEGKRHLIVVPSGALTALPFHLLVTEKPAAIPDFDHLSRYGDAAWLIKRQAVSVLPSVASLSALRLFARDERDLRPLIGFGDPVFNTAAATAAEKQRGLRKKAARSLETLAYTSFWQGAGVDRRQLGRSLQQLPETADELKAVAQSLGAPAADIHLGKDASVTAVKRAPLADYRVVYFATHGLVAGDVKGLAEPSLALTIPPQPTDLDDGLLTASEIAQLKLDADWVVLSACNTAAGGKPGAEALSGLARAFFYAGARALLVTHWSVDSEAATRLTTTTFSFLKGEPALGRAEAVRRAMLAYLNDTSKPRDAYPAIWGAFSIIGEGAAR